MVKKIILIFLFFKLILIFFTVLAQFFPINQNPGFNVEYLRHINFLQSVWANFDGANYLEIAKVGYQYPYYAYFPLLPLTIFLGHLFFKIPALSTAIILNNTANLLSLLILYKLTLADYNKNIALKTALFLIVFPLSFYYSAIYTESLFFLFSLLCFYAARKSRWGLASVFGFLAGLTRLVGLVLFFGLVIEWWWQNRSSGKNLIKNFFTQKIYMLLLIPFGLIAYGLYLQIFHGDFWLFQKAMEPWGQADFINPLQTVFRYLKIIFLASKNYPYFIAILELVSFIFYIFLSLYVLLKSRLSYGVWMIVSLLIPTFTGTLQSMPRYILHLFPAFIALSLIFKTRKSFIFVSVISLILQFILVVLFTRGYFVA